MLRSQKISSSRSGWRCTTACSRFGGWGVVRSIYWRAPGRWRLRFDLLQKRAQHPVHRPRILQRAEVTRARHDDQARRGSPRRNPVIAEVLRQMGKMTTVGRGLALIRQEMAALGSPPPEFHSDNQHFRVILPSRHIALRSNRSV